MNESSNLTQKDRKCLSYTGLKVDLEELSHLVIGEHKIGWIQRIDLRDRSGRLSWSAEHWGQDHYYNVSHVNRNGNGGGGGGVRTEAEALERLGRITGRVIYTEMRMF